MGNHSDRLSGKRILVVDEDYIVAAETARALVEAGAEVIGPARLVELSATVAACLMIDVVVMDVPYWETAKAERVAVELLDRGIPVVLHTALLPRELPPVLAATLLLPKWVPAERIVISLAEVVIRPCKRAAAVDRVNV
jgi:BarA-like signal transduction histidine kinase